jgi:hypothetical protein
LIAILLFLVLGFIVFAPTVWYVDMLIPNSFKGPTIFIIMVAYVVAFIYFATIIYHKLF